MASSASAGEDNWPETKMNGHKEVYLPAAVIGRFLRFADEVAMPRTGVGRNKTLLFSKEAILYIRCALQSYLLRLSNDVANEKRSKKTRSGSKVLWCGRRGRNIREVPAMTQMIDKGLGGPGEGARLCRSSRSRWPLYHPLYAAPIPARTKVRIRQEDFIRAEVCRRRGDRALEKNFLLKREKAFETKFKEAGIAQAWGFAAPKGI